ncbi:hypothetical protein TNCV_1778071 [Trichonephila clavipes]|nr:hypothetical protein TNCV_1778071 [Trichonephila clavipes]
MGSNLYTGGIFVDGSLKNTPLHRQINLEVDSVFVQELLDSYNRELAIDEFTEMHEQEQNIQKLESLYPVHSETRMMVGNPR